FACGFSANTSSSGFKEKELFVLFAILLKPWRVSSPFYLCCSFTYFRTSSSELAEYKRSVLYSRLPAQFDSLSFVARAKRGETTGLAIIAEKSLIKVLLFIAMVQARSTLATGISATLASKARQLYNYFFSFHRADPLGEPECAARMTVTGYARPL